MDTQTYVVLAAKHRTYDIYRADEMDQDPIGRGHYGAGDAWFRWEVIGDGSGKWIKEFREKFVALIELHISA